jgi:phage antirepressor YoqD-like protein
MSAAMQLAELRVKRPLAEYIRQEYIAKGRMGREVAADLGIDTSTLTRWMRELGIDARPRGRGSEAAIA